MLTWREAWLELKQICENPEGVDGSPTILQSGHLVATGLCTLISNLCCEERITLELRVKMDGTIPTWDTDHFPWMWPRTLEGAKMRAEFCAEMAETEEPC